MSDDDHIASPSAPPKPEWHVVRALLTAITVVALVAAVIAALGALTYAIFGFTGLVVFAIASLLVLCEIGGLFLDWLFRKLWNAISPAVPQPVLRKLQIAFAIIAIVGSVVYCVITLR